MRNMKKVSAAILIQRTWRCYKAHSNYELVSNFFREKPMPMFKAHDLTNMAKKFVALAQFSIAKNKFRELMRPIDLKTVVQSYRDGQTEVLLRAKLLQQTMDRVSQRVEMNENHMCGMSMRMETKQNLMEDKLDSALRLMESCNRRLLANNMLIQLTHQSQFMFNNYHNNVKTPRSPNSKAPRKPIPPPLPIVGSVRLNTASNVPAGTPVVPRTNDSSTLPVAPSNVFSQLDINQLEYFISILQFQVKQQKEMQPPASACSQDSKTTVDTDSDSDKPNGKSIQDQGKESQGPSTSSKPQKMVRKTKITRRKSM